MVDVWDSAAGKRGKHPGRFLQYLLEYGLDARTGAHTLGICCDEKHPALAAFPNEGVSDYQWWDLLSRCDAMCLDAYSKDLRPIVYLIDDWFTNRKLGMLFEARVGKGKLLVCSADLQHDLETRPAAAQFRQSLLEYMASDRFAPVQELEAAVLAD